MHRYVDGFYGRVPKSVLAKHHTDFSPEKLKEIYDGAGLRRDIGLLKHIAKAF